MDQDQINNEPPQHFDGIINSFLEDMDVVSSDGLDAMASVYGLHRRVESDDDLRQRILQTIKPPSTSDDLEQRTIRD